MSGAFMRASLLIRASRVAGFSLGHTGVPSRVLRGEAPSACERKRWPTSVSDGELELIALEDQADVLTADEWHLGHDEAAA